MPAKKQKKKKKAKPITALPVIRPNVAGIDLGSRSHWVAGPARNDGKANVEEFLTTTSQLNALAEWLEEQGVTSVAMESTGIYWIPVYEILESRGFEVLLVNARHLGSVPGRKTDVADCQWIQMVHSCGLLKGSFRPDESICALRALKRQCTNLVNERSKAVQWMQKALDQMNIKVHHAVSSLTGKTGMAIVRDIISGERDAAKLAFHRDIRCKKSVEEIAEYLTGNWREEHLFNLEMALNHYDHIQSMIETYEAKLIKEMDNLHPEERKEMTVPPHPNRVKEKGMKRRGEQKMRETLWRLSGVDLCRIDGISVECAQVIITEAGFELSDFVNENKFAAWLRLTPRHGVSGGKPLNKKRNRSMGASRIAFALTMGAMTLRNSKTALGAYFRSVSRRKGFSVAKFATARKLAIIAYRMLKFGAEYVDIGENAYEQQFLERRMAGLKNSAKSMGYELTPMKEAG